MKKHACAALIAATLPAVAQEGAPIVVLYQPAEGRYAYLVDQTMAIVLARPGFVKAARADAQTLLVSVPEKSARVGNGEAVPFNFTLHFARDGDMIGEAVEDCVSDKLAACADQVASDLASAAALQH